MPATTPAPSYMVRDITYTVPSATQPGKDYQVTVDTRGYSCTCTAGSYRRPCWHIKAVRTGQVKAKPRARLALAAPAPKPIGIDDVYPTA